MSEQAFAYRAVDDRGRRAKGVTHAHSQAEAYRRLVADGLTPVRIRLESGKRRARGKRVPLKDIAHFTYQLSVLISARVPLSDGIRTIGEQEPSPVFRQVILQIASRIEAGGRIADAIEEHPRIFSEIYVESVRAAEQSGTLSSVLEYLSETLERSLDQRQQLRSALAYPIVVVTVLVIAVTFLIGYVVPKFGRMYEARGVDLPFISQVLLGLGNSIQGFWWLYLGAAAATAFAIKRARSTQRGRAVIERVLRRVPYVKTVLSAVSVARFARVFGLCITSGVNLIDAIALGGRASGSASLEAETELIVNRVKSGEGLSQALRTSNEIPAFAKRMLTAGEASGELPRMASVIARHHERETAVATKYLTTVLEPILIVLVAGVVLVVALAVFLPMWDLVTLIG